MEEAFQQEGSIIAKNVVYETEHKEIISKKI
jgi:hypothetical protein